MRQKCFIKLTINFLLFLHANAQSEDVLTDPSQLTKGPIKFVEVSLFKVKT